MNNAEQLVREIAEINAEIERLEELRAEKIIRLEELMIADAS